MVIKYSKYLAVMALVLLLCGCFKELSYKTQYVVRATVQIGTDNNVEDLDNVVAYAFDADTTDWQVASYQDALDGVLTSKEDGTTTLEPVSESKMFTNDAQYPDSAWWVELNFDLPRAMIVVVDTNDKIFCYRNQELGVNLSPMFVTVAFQPYRALSRYKVGAWQMVNEFYVPSTTQSANQQ